MISLIISLTTDSRCLDKVPIRVPLMEHELLTHSKNLRSPTISGVRVNQTYVYVVFW